MRLVLFIVGVPWQVDRQTESCRSPLHHRQEDHAGRLRSLGRFGEVPDEWQEEALGPGYPPQRERCLKHDDVIKIGLTASGASMPAAPRLAGQRAHAGARGGSRGAGARVSLPPEGAKVQRIGRPRIPELACSTASSRAGWRESIALGL